MSIEGNILELEPGTESIENNDPDSISGSNGNNDGSLQLELESDSQSSEIENADNSSSSVSTSSLSSDSLFLQDFSNYYDSIIISVIVMVGAISAYFIINYFLIFFCLLELKMYLIELFVMCFDPIPITFISCCSNNQ